MSEVITADVSDIAAISRDSAKKVEHLPNLAARAIMITFIAGVLVQIFSMTLADILIAAMLLELVFGIVSLTVWQRRMTRHYGDLAGALGLSRLPTLTDLDNGYLAGTSWTTGAPTTVVVDDDRTHGWAFPAPCDSLPESEGESCPSPQS